MFRKSNKDPQLDAFTSVPMMLESSAYKQYSDKDSWHNQFHDHILSRVDETIFSVLYNNTTGAPNSPIRILVGMMILKESFVWSDSQLFEQCRFNVLVRGALGLFNMNDPLPVESTYYILRKRLYEHQKQTGEDLMGKSFAQVTSEQVREFDVNGRSIRMDSKLIGIIIYNLLTIFCELQTEPFLLLRRVFNEQYKVLENQQIELRPKEEITSSSVQSPHDPDSTYRNKGDQKVKGYSVNITETCSEEGLNLVTNVLVEKANTPDTAFVEPAIQATIEVTGQPIDKAYADGAYQSPANDQCCEGIDMVFTGIQGFESRYDLEMTPQGLLVTDTKTGELHKAVLVKKLKNSKEDRWRIETPTGSYYFGQQAIRTSTMRRKMKARPLEELHKRNNVEATIFQFGIPLHNGKSKYRGQIKQKMWACCRCLWSNLVRIINFTKQICQRTFTTMFLPAMGPFYPGYVEHPLGLQPDWRRNLPTAWLFAIIINFFVLS